MDVIAKTEELLAVPQGSIRGKHRHGPIAIARLIAYKASVDLGTDPADFVKEIGRCRTMRYRLNETANNLYDVDRDFKAKVELIKTLCHED